MKTYYEYLNISKNASMKEIEVAYNIIKSHNKNNIQIDKAYETLIDYHKRKQYDELLTINTSTNNSSYTNLLFNELYTKSNERKRYLINDNLYLIYEKQNINGEIIKKYYIEKDGHIELLSNEKLLKLKKIYYSSVLVPT